MNKKVIIISIVFLLLGVFSGSVFWFVRYLPHMDKLLNYQHKLATVVYDKKGKVMGEYYLENRRWVPIEKISKNIIYATIAVEDRQFEKHWGINIYTIFRALIKDIIKRKKVEGASTITQQLARDMFLTKKKTIIRKLQEAILAMEIERLYSKDEILEMYLNQIYYGEGAYGVEAAAETYFGKHALNLTLPEAALIVGIPKYPLKYNPKRNPEYAFIRRNIVLEVMANAGYIQHSEAERLKNEPLGIIIKEKGYNNAPYFMEEIRKFLVSRYGEDILYKGGLKVYSSCDLTIQKKAEEIFEEHIRKMEIERHYEYNIINGFVNGKPRYLEGALLVESVGDGSILAMIGGRKYKQSSFNRATQAKRQVGSAFKPFVYLSAIDNGYNASDIILDAPIVVELKGVKDENKKIYKPSNFDNKFMGPITLREALAHSRNLATIRLLQRIGPYTVIDYAKRCGITEKLHPYLSLAIGSASITLEEMVSAYQTLANQGEHIMPHMIDSIVDPKGNMVYMPNIERKQVISRQSDFIIVNMMKSVISEGTGRYARILGVKKPVAGKTGTTDNFTDAWFIGFNPDVVCGVWIGFDSLKTMGKNATGAVMALPIWAKLVKALIQGDSLTPPMFKEGDDFIRPDGIVMRRICEQSGLLATPYCPKIRNEYFIQGNEPRQKCNLHGPGGANSENIWKDPNILDKNKKENKDEIFH